MHTYYSDTRGCLAPELNIIHKERISNMKLFKGCILSIYIHIHIPVHIHICTHIYKRQTTFPLKNNKDVKGAQCLVKQRHNAHSI